MRRVLIAPPNVKVAACRRAAEIVKAHVAAPPAKKHSDTPEQLLGKYFEVRQVKSTIGLPSTLKLLFAQRLGIRRLWTPYYLPITRFTVESLTRGRHIVKLAIVDDLPVRRPKEPQYTVAYNWMQEPQA